MNEPSWKEKMTIDVLNYVLDSELDDFENNPSDNHVYYKAIFSLYGRMVANDILNNALQKINA